MTPSPIKTIPEFIVRVLELRTAWFPTDPCEEIWYRGVKDALKLIPGAYWRTKCDEVSLELSFRAAVPGLLPHQPTDDWEWYYLMQHYGLPTRLLDWTENPLAALFFALDGADATKQPGVWVLDPVALNTLSGEPFVFTPTNPNRPIDGWLSRKCHRGAVLSKFDRNDDNNLADNRLPVAIYPKRHNPRLIAQRGTFTVHGIDENPIEKLDLKRTAGDSACLRIDIDPASCARLRDELWAVGMTKTLIYPEPQSLADDLKRMYGVG
jgi:hypothetical protein